MAQICIADLTFCYEGSFDPIFEHVSFSIDSDWRLGLIGRNGKGKTTFLKLLLGTYRYAGSITSSATFDYFPYEVPEEKMHLFALDLAKELKPGCEQWQVICELAKLDAPDDLLYRPFWTLSHGERTKVFLAILFSGENDFLLIDEPTNHLDQGSRKSVKQYLHGKKGFILTSHDRDLLDACTDHVLVLNRRSIEIQKGNFSSWWENKNKRDHFEQAENEKHIREIASLKKAAEKSRRWAYKSENSKIGFNPIKEHDRSVGARAYIGGKTKKMQKRSKQYEKRMEKEIAAKKELLLDVEDVPSLKLSPLVCPKEQIITCKSLTAGYAEGRKDVLRDFSFELKKGERVFLHGKNGCGKSTFLKTILAKSGHPAACGEGSPAILSGQLHTCSGLAISYINQDTGLLKGGIRDFCVREGLDESLFCTLLRKLGMERVQFSKNLEDFSNGQKKKAMIAAGLMTPAHLYIWDEPLNYIDVFSRMQLEELLLLYKPTMILVEHDVRFQQKIATRVVEMK